MRNRPVDRRSFLKAMGTAGMLPALPEMAFSLYPRGGHVLHEFAGTGFEDEKPKYSVKFGVIGLDHYHIMGMTAAVIRGGGELVSFYTGLPKAIADFQKIYPNAKLAGSEDEILSDPSIQLICGAPIPYLRAPLGIRAMKHGKDFLSDKPAVTTLEQLAEVRKVSEDTGRMFAIMYSERLEVKAAVQAGYLIKDGAIGKVVQTINIAPHKVNDITRPDWFWDPEKYGGFCAISGRTKPISSFTTQTRRLLK